MLIVQNTQSGKPLNDMVGHNVEQQLSRRLFIHDVA